MTKFEGKDATKNEVINILENSSNVAIYSHINTDCDAMGSVLALRAVLLGLGKSVSVFIDSNFPNNFTFYGDLSFINKKMSDSFDLAVCLDCANESRLGKFKFTYRKGGIKTLNIDHHHVSSEKFCKFNYVLNASSTAEILCDLFDCMKVKLDTNTCKNLFSGILTDTGKFAHGATGETFKICSKLIEIGKFSMEDVYVPLFNSMTMGVYQMMKKAYKNTELFDDNKLAILMFRVSDFIETGTTMDDLDAFADLPLQIESVKLAILASESDKGFFRVSFRSKGKMVSTKAVAEIFGGGGHFNASGCKIFGSFDEVRQRLIDAAMLVLGESK